MLSPSVIKVGKTVGKLIVGVGLPLLTNYVEKRQLRAEITKIATEIVDKAIKQS
jgi:hypothetical protein